MTDESLRSEFERQIADHAFLAGKPRDTELGQYVDLDLGCAFEGYKLCAEARGKDTAGVRAIADERRRQIEVEGWTAQHDVQNRYGELASAAACYAVGSDAYWPWHPEWWKPTNRRRDLVKAGALIAAEIDRLDRRDAAMGKEG